MAASYTIGIDLGGTYIKGGVCDADCQPVCKDSVATETDGGPAHVIDRMAELVRSVISQAGLSDADIAGVGVGAPGPMSAAKGIIYSAPNLPGFENLPLSRELHERTGLPVVLENDANAAAFGEFTIGAGRDVNTIVMLTLGTGVGGGIVLDGTVWRGPFENAGEIGHTIVALDGRPCPCGQRGCLERYSSANAIGERAVEALQDGAASSLREAWERGERITSREVREAMLAGDELASRIWDEACRYLAAACVNLQHTLCPERVVLAGGLINAGAHLLDPVRTHFDAMSWKIANDRPEIVFATLGTDAGMIGAAALARGAGQ